MIRAMPVTRSENGDRTPLDREQAAQQSSRDEAVQLLLFPDIVSGLDAFDSISRYNVNLDVEIPDIVSTMDHTFAYPDIESTLARSVARTCFTLTRTNPGPQASPTAPESHKILIRTRIWRRNCLDRGGMAGGSQLLAANAVAAARHGEGH